MSPERDPCPWCGEPVALEARLCPHCDRSTLVNVRLQSPPPAGRARYQLARSLAALGAGLRPFLDIQANLGSPNAILAESVSRGQARQVLELLEANGGAGRTEPASLPASRRALGPWVPWAAAAGLAVLGLWAWSSLRPARIGSKPRGPSPQPLAAVSSPPRPLSTQELARRVLPSTVSVRCSNSVGAGFFADSDLILTNAHVLCAGGERPNVVLASGRELPGDVMSADQALDLALVRVTGAGIPPLPLGDAGALAVGDTILVVGSPYGLEFSLNAGAISNLSRPILGVSYLQIDAQVNPGNSGGPLLDSEGRVVGIVSLKHSQAEGISFALPINYAYTGERPLVTGPAGAASSAGFGEMLAKANATDQEATREIASLVVRPGIVGAYVDQYRRLVARILLPSPSMPRRQELSFRLRSGAEEICVMKGDVSEWKVVDQQEAGDAFAERAAAWLEKNGFHYYLYVGDAALRWDLCPREKVRPGIELELEDADPRAARVPLR
jgi:S1-C subfamily serine protease